MGWNKQAQARQGRGARPSPRQPFVPAADTLTIDVAAWHQAGDATSTDYYNYWNSPGVLPWNVANGDWVDSADQANGSTAYYTPQWDDPSGGHPFQRAFQVTDIIQEAIDGANTGDGIFLRAESGTSWYKIATLFHPTQAAPSLTITYSVGDPSVIEASHVCPIKTSTSNRLGNDATALIQNNLGHCLFRFDLTGESGTVTNATVYVQVIDHFDGTSLNMGVYRTEPKVQKSITVEQGIANGYMADDGIEAHGSVIEYLDFGEENGSPRWKGVGQPPFWTREHLETPPRAKITVETGKNYGSDIHFGFTQNELTPPTEIYFRYYLMLDGATWPGIVSGGKFPGFGGQGEDGLDQGGNGGQDTTGTNGWSARGQYSSDTSANNPMKGRCALGTYSYHIDDSLITLNAGYGEVVWWTAHNNYTACIEMDTWYCIEQRLKLNTYSGGTGVKDGILEAWVDGKKCFSRTNYRWVSDANHPIEWIWFNIYHGGTTDAVSDHIAYVRDIVIATEYIGPQG